MKAPGLIVAIGSKGGPPPLDTPGKRAMAPTAEHEASETPEYETREETGANLIEEMLKPIVDAGADEDHAKAILAEMFAAAAKCLRGEGETGVEDRGLGAKPGEGEYGQ
jgi:hypothetical protein